MTQEPDEKDLRITTTRMYEAPDGMTFKAYSDAVCYIMGCKIKDHVAEKLYTSVGKLEDALLEDEELYEMMRVFWRHNKPRKMEMQQLLNAVHGLPSDEVLHQDAIGSADE